MSQTITNSTTTTTSPTPASQDAVRAELGRKMFTLRQKVNSTQAEMARTLGVLPGYLSHIERAYNGIALDRVMSIVAQAYKEFSVPYEPPAIPQVAAPGEVEAEALAGIRNTRPEVARRITEFQREFSLAPRDLAKLFGVSDGHEYVLRTGRASSSLATRQKVVAIIDQETQRRRAAATATPVVAVAPPVAPSATTPRAARPVERATDVFVASGYAELLAALTCDFQTMHRFTKLPDGSILVVKGV